MPPSAKLKQLVDHSLEIDIEIAEAKSLKWVCHVLSALFH